MRPLALLLAALALPASAQGVIGTWEMTAAENVPVSEDLVFTRMTFADGRLYTTAVFLDADDGDLAARITEDRYRESAGQLVVEALGSTAILEYAREVDQLTVRDLETGVALTLRPADPADAFDPALVGAWAGAGGGHAWRFRFADDGHVVVNRDDGGDDDEDYTVAGPYLVVDDDVYRFTFLDDRLILDRGDATLELSRAGSGPDTRP